MQNKEELEQNEGGMVASTEKNADCTDNACGDETQPSRAPSTEKNQT